MPKTLLLADDSVTIQKVVGISFANEDVVLVTVDNGDDAIAKARELRPDIVLADVVMPGRSGYEVCEAIKGDPELSHVPVLLLTGTFEAFDQERANGVGADGHITKPFEAQALVDQVNARLAEASAPSGGPTPAEPPSEPLVSSTDATLLSATPIDPAPGQDDSLGFDDAPAGAPTEAYDFFGDSGVEASSPPERDVQAATTVLVGDDLGVGGEAPQSFAFEAPEEVHDELSVPAPESPIPEIQPTVQRVEAPAPAEAPDPEPSFAEDSDAFAHADTLPPVAPDPPAFEMPAPVEDTPEPEASTDPFASQAPSPAETMLLQGDDDLGLGAVGPEDLAGESVVDPDAAGAYDVSSSDLGDPLAAGSPSDDATVAHIVEPVEEPADSWAAPAEPLPVQAEEAEVDAGPFAVAQAAETSLQEEPILGDPDPAPEAVVPPAPAAQARPDLSPYMREQVHEAIEKIAWEAFGEVTDKIVESAVERIEQIAWEVIPQMAETLIQEEIRKLKGDE